MKPKLTVRDAFSLKRWKLWVGVSGVVGGWALYDDAKMPWGMKSLEEPWLMFLGIMILLMGFLLAVVDFNSLDDEYEVAEGETFNFIFSEYIGILLIVVGISLVTAFAPWTVKGGAAYGVPSIPVNTPLFVGGFVLILIGSFMIYRGPWFNENVLKRFKSGEEEDVE